MSLQVDYYFSLISPFSYLGNQRLHQICASLDVEVNYLPFRIGRIFEATGGLPPAKRHVSRQAYRIAELKRWSTRLGLPLNLEPKHFPTNDIVANGAVVAAAKQDADKAGELAQVLHQACWVHDLDLSDLDLIHKSVDGLGLDADAIMADAGSDAWAQKIEANTDAAIAANVFGAPTVVLGDESFWGQDRWDFLEDALKRSASNALAKQLST